MKRFLIVFHCFFVMLVFAQEVKTQKDILQLPNTDLVKDFNLKIGSGNIKPIAVSKSTYSDYGYTRVGHKFAYLVGDFQNETLTFDEEFLLKKVNEYKFGNNFLKPKSFDFNYTYKNGLLKTQKSNSVYNGKIESSEETIYDFNSQGSLKEVKQTSQGKTVVTKYITDNNTIKNDFDNGKHTYILKNGLITKKITFNKSANKTYTNSYKYNSDGFLEFEDKGTYKYTYQLSKNNLIEKEVDKDRITRHYKYIYDAYGNWVIAYHLATSDKDYSGNKVKTHLFGGEFSFEVREIKYSNGDITGSINLEDGKTKAMVVKLRNGLYSELIDKKTKVVKSEINKEIFGLPKTDLVEDFNLKIGDGNIIPKNIVEKQYDQRTKRGSQEISSKLIRSRYKVFDTKIKKITNYNIVNDDKTTYQNYTYNATGNLIKYKNKGSSINTEKNIQYEQNGNFSFVTKFNDDVDGIKYQVKKTSDGYILSGLSNQKFIVKNNFVQKLIVGYDKKEPSETTFKYNSYNQLITEESYFYTTSYQYNSNGEIEVSEEKSNTNNDTTTRRFVYAYDTYGNWIISLSLLDMSIVKGIPSFPDPTLREITYSNGEVTGTTDIDKVKNELINLRKKVRALESSSLSGVASWKKTAATSYLFTINNQQEALNSSSVFMGKSLLVFHKTSSQLFVFENFEDKPVGQDFPAKKATIDLKNGYWYKTQKGGVHVFRSDGTYIKNVAVYKFAPNNKDAIFKGENESNTVVLENYTTVDVFTPYPVTAYSNYKPTESDNITDNAEKLKESLDKYHEALSGACLVGDCNNGYGEQELNDGRKAEGFFKDGKPYGPMHIYDEKSGKSTLSVFNGSFQSQEGFVYQYDGADFMIFTDASKNIGFYNNYKTKNTYQFNYSNGKVVSKTILLNNSNSKCVVGNCTNGVGIYEYDNSTYMGTFKNGIREGFGYLFFKNSSNNYIGEFSNGMYHGLGTFTTSDFDYSMGYYQNGKMNGQGIKYDAKDKFRAGNWINGQLEGNTTKTNLSNSTTTSNHSEKSTTASHLSEVQTNRILACKEDSKCIARYFTELYVEERKTLSGDALINKTTGYFHSFYKMNPKLAFKTLFKMDLTLIDIKLLPQNVQDDIKARAQKISDGHQEHLKSKGY